MCNYIIKILNITCIICLLLYYGCSDQAEQHERAMVISKNNLMPKKEQKIKSSNSKTIKKSLKPKKNKTMTGHDQKIKEKIDPFVSIFKENFSDYADQNDSRKQKLIPLTPIEKVNLSQLKLVGIINAISGNRALVEDTSGKGFVIKEGINIGINAGKVIKILKNCVVVEEEAKSTLGKKILVKRELKFQNSPGTK